MLPANPNKEQAMNETFSGAVARIQNGKLTLPEVADAKCLKMADWTRLTGAVYPRMKKETIYRPQFLCDSKQHNPDGLKSKRG